eukprot:TRINITY_DN43429_c1_g3_i1.p1 TRINITY_DN43429_c1_g3~~TRINITY_DN43429_c1_g3_i1.p1  ORF type:complete len:140 (-),score=17.53 TRINITY_DN43429_c1_g3_i1:4-423(-)
MFGLEMYTKITSEAFDLQPQHKYGQRWSPSTSDATDRGAEQLSARDTGQAIEAWDLQLRVESMQGMELKEKPRTSDLNVLLSWSLASQANAAGGAPSAGRCRQQTLSQIARSGTPWTLRSPSHVVAMAKRGHRSCTNIQ